MVHSSVLSAQHADVVAGDILQLANSTAAPATSSFSKLHIVLVKRRCSLRYGGGERYSVNLTRGLLRLGHRVSIVGEEIDDEIREQVDFHPVQVNHLASWTKIRSFARNAGQVCKELSADVIYGLCPTPEADAIRVTSRIHAEWMRIRYPSPWQYWAQSLNPRHRTIIALERECYALATRVKIVVAQSSLDAKLLQQYHGISAGKIRIIRNGVDAELFHPREKGRAEDVRRSLAIPSQGKLIVLAGGVTLRGKGLETLLEAIAGCNNRRLFLAVLSGASHAPWLRMAQELGVESQVRFIQRRNDLPRFLAAADLFALPTVYEPFPNVVLEAMSCGVPVMTTRRCGLADVVEDGVSGYLVENSDCVREMTTNLQSHFDQPEQHRIQMGQKARSIAEGMHLEWHALQVERMLREVAYKRCQQAA